MTQENLVIDVGITDKAYDEVGAFGTRLYGMPTQSVWFQNILVSLLDSNIREYEHLKAGLDMSSTPLIAWACRNMLELDIFTKFCLAKGSNAEEFVSDMWIDSFDIFSSFREWIKFHNPAAQTPMLDQTIDNLIQKKAQQGIVRGYLKVSAMAATVNLADEYQRINKATSKLVHPTAFSVFGKNHEELLFKELMQIFFGNAVRYGLDVYNDVKDHIEKYGVEPLP